MLQKGVSISASDETSIDIGVLSFNGYTPATQQALTQYNVHSVILLSMPAFLPGHQSNCLRRGQHCCMTAQFGILLSHRTHSAPDLTKAYPEASVPTAVPGDAESQAAEAGQAHREAAVDV